ncbi:MAG: cation-translocating P-type ATPase [Chlamydiales bacterium]
MTVITPPQEPLIFDDFFEKGLPEGSSPFLTPSSRKWGVNLELKTSIAAIFLLIGAFILHFFESLIPLSNLLLIGVYFLAGIPSLIDSIEDICKLEINIDVLMTVAAFSSVLIGSPIEGALLLVLFAMSEAMEEAVTAKAKGAISSLYKLSPTIAWVMDEQGKISPRSVKDIRVGTKILVKAGEVVPLDGKVVDGVSALNLVHLTGENLPITKKQGDDVPAGGRNLDGALTVEVVRTSGDSTISRIIELVTQAQESKPQLQRWFDRLSRRYAMSVILLAAFFSLALPFAFSLPFFGPEGSIYRSLAFLIAASPCALIIATPMAYLSAVSICARKGILVKGGATLDAIASCQVIAFDKTGTLTTGDLRYLGIAPLNPTFKTAEETLLGVAASLEKRAVHPVAQAIVNHTYSQNIPPIAISNFRNIPGYGVEGNTLYQDQSVNVFVGNPDYVKELLPSDELILLESKVEDLRKEGYLLAVMKFNNEIYIIKFLDSIRPSMKSTIQALRKNGDKQLVMLTGDHLENAKKIAADLGLHEVYADLKPEDKLRHVSALAESKGLAMVGDGINDAPALARATVGICMGKIGSATAAEAADVVLLHDNLEYLNWLIDKARATQRIVTENIVLAGAVILLATTPALLGWIPLWAAVVLHEGGTVVVGLNALRLLKN